MVVAIEIVAIDPNSCSVYTMKPPLWSHRRKSSYNFDPNLDFPVTKTYTLEQTKRKSLGQPPSQVGQRVDDFWAHGIGFDESDTSGV